MEFFLTKNFLTILKKSTKINSSIEPGKINFNNDDCLAILRLNGFKFFSESSKFVGLLVFDGEIESTFLIYKEYLETLNEFRQGSIFVLRELEYKNYKNLESSQFFDLIVYNITSLFIIGSDNTNDTKNENSNKDRDNEEEEDLILLNYDLENATRVKMNDANTTEQTEEEKSNITENFKISSLNADLVNKRVTIDAILVDKTKIKTFKSNDQRSFIRLLFSDETASVECIGYNKDAIEIDKLEINKHYRIENVELKFRNKKFTNWPKSNSIDFDLNIITVTKFIPGNANKLKRKYDDDIDQNNNSKKTKMERAKDNDMKPGFIENERIKCFEELVEILKSKKREERKLVNVIGIISRIDEPKMIVSKEILLRNFYIINEKAIEIKVAVWGKEAELFNYKTGTVLFLRNVNLTDQSGLSLSVIRESSFCLLPDEFKDEKVKELREWWKMWWKRSSKDYTSINSLLSLSRSYKNK